MRHTVTRSPRFDREWKELIKMLPEQRQSAMEQAIRNYQLTGIYPEHLEEAEMMAFMLIKKIVDRRTKQREARHRKLEISDNEADNVERVQKERKPSVKESQRKCSIWDFSEIERDADGAIIIRSSEDMQRAINYHRQVRTDPAKVIRYRYLGK
ncbi:MAG: DUF6291 domain-containing protein [Muribaculum sp.]|nr:DUF6291 domain-containing protein [Muribaculum sp.]